MDSTTFNPQKKLQISTLSCKFINNSNTKRYQMPKCHNKLPSAYISECPRPMSTRCTHTIMVTSNIVSKWAVGTKPNGWVMLFVYRYRGTMNECAPATIVGPSSTSDCVAIKSERSGHSKLHPDCHADHLVFPISCVECSL